MYCKISENKNDESVGFAVELVKRQRLGFISTTFIHTQQISMKAKLGEAVAERGIALWYVE